MSETNELKFQKLAEVELLEKAPGGSHPLVEHEGKIKRVTGGGEGGGAYVWDLTEHFQRFQAGDENYTFLDGYGFMQFPLTEEEAMTVYEGTIAAGGLVAKIDGFSLGLLGFYTVSGPQTLVGMEGDEVVVYSLMGIGSEMVPFIMASCTLGSTGMGMVALPTFLGI